jgi:hypothetical protein
MLGARQSPQGRAAVGVGGRFPGCMRHTVEDRERPDMRAREHGTARDVNDDVENAVAIGSIGRNGWDGDRNRRRSGKRTQGDPWNAGDVEEREHRDRDRPRPPKFHASKVSRFCYFYDVAERGFTATAAVAIALVFACGSERPRAAEYGTDRETGDGRSFDDSPGGTTPPACGTRPDGSQCECVDVPLFIDPPTMYFVLDRSGSMAESNKWWTVRSVVAKIVRGIGPRAKFGTALFPEGSAVCGRGVEVVSVRPGDPPSSTADGPTTTAILAATRVFPGGGTPTGTTLEALRPGLERLPGEVFVILATDGAPNCNDSASCGYDQCQLNIEGIDGCSPSGPENCCETSRGNCNDVPATSGAIQKLAQRGIPTYVIGLPGAAPYAGALDAMAVAGRTAQPGAPKYLAVNAASEDAILAALKKVAAKIVGTCTFTLKEAPADPKLVNVYLDDEELTYEPESGWTLADKTVTLVGSACERVKSGDALNVRIIAGCPRREPR